MNPSDRSALLRLQVQVRGSIQRGLVTADRQAGLAQALQLSMPSDEVRPQVLDQVEQAQPYGLSARPLPGAEAVLVALAGRPEALVAVQVADRRYRRTNLEPGEVVLHDWNGNRVAIRVGGLVHVVAATEIRLVAPLVKINGDLEVVGNVTATGDVSDSAGTTPTMAAMRAAYNVHAHGASGPPAPPM